MGHGSGQSQGMMGGGMMGMMGQMGEHHQQMSGLMDKLMASMAAIQSEKDPDALKSKLAEHQRLLEQMHGQMMQQGNRMKMMSGQMKQQCSGAGDNSTVTSEIVRIGRGSSRTDLPFCRACAIRAQRPRLLGKHNEGGILIIPKYTCVTSSI